MASASSTLIWGLCLLNAFCLFSWIGGNELSFLSATPDVSSYVYDESSGYYYDATTQLYYDANSQYYYNSVTNKYMYWSGEHSTFLPAPDEQKDVTSGKDEERGKKEAKSKVKDL